MNATPSPASQQDCAAKQAAVDIAQVVGGGKRPQITAQSVILKAPEANQVAPAGS